MLEITGRAQSRFLPAPMERLLRVRGRGMFSGGNQEPATAGSRTALTASRVALLAGKRKRSLCEAEVAEPIRAEGLLSHISEVRIYTHGFITGQLLCGTYQKEMQEANCLQ